MPRSQCPSGNVRAAAEIIPATRESCAGLTGKTKRPSRSAVRAGPRVLQIGPPPGSPKRRCPPLHRATQALQPPPPIHPSLRRTKARFGRRFPCGCDSDWLLRICTSLGLRRVRGAGGSDEIVDFAPGLIRFTPVGFERSRPASQGIPPKHCTPPVSRAVGAWRILPPRLTFRRRHSNQVGPTTTARSAACSQALSHSAGR